MRTSIAVNIRPFPVPETVRADITPLARLVLASAPSLPAAGAPGWQSPPAVEIDGHSFTYADMAGAGWTDRELRDAGYGHIVPGAGKEPVVDRTVTLELKTLEPEQLDELCAQFRRAVFERAGKSEPIRADAAPCVKDGYDYSDLRASIGRLDIAVNKVEAYFSAATTVEADVLERLRESLREIQRTWG